MTSAISLLSGGLDSIVAMLLAKKESDIALSLTFDYGQRAADREVGAAKEICDRYGIEHRVIKVDWLKEITKTALVSNDVEVPKASGQSLDDLDESKKRAGCVWVPNRNGLFANVAACFADSMNADMIVMGLNAEEGAAFSDNTVAFANSLDECFSLSTGSHPKIVAPTIGMTKAEIAEKAVELNVTRFWSCYHGAGRMCGECESCARTVRAFREIGKYDLIADRFEGVRT